MQGAELWHAEMQLQFIYSAYNRDMRCGCLGQSVPCALKPGALKIFLWSYGEKYAVDMSHPIRKLRRHFLIEKWEQPVVDATVNQNVKASPWLEKGSELPFNLYCKRYAIKVCNQRLKKPGLVQYILQFEAMTEHDD